MSRRRLIAWTAGAAAVASLLLGCVFYLNPRCDDQIHNGSETDVDCGGSCGPCALNRSCDVGADCQSGNCVDGTCRPLPCFNGVRDGAETDVDCGGGTCRKCAGGRHCKVDADCFGGTCQPGSGTCSALAVVSFADAVSYGASFKTYALFYGDLDGDGHVDLAAANEQDNSITVLINHGNGTFRNVVPNFGTGAYPTGGTVADFNRDGIPDIVTANYHGNSVSVLVGKGDGTFQAAREYPTIAGGATSNLAVGDLNGDGFPDVIATNPDKASVSQFMGRADGTLDPAIDVPVGIHGGSSPFSAAIGDFNGDGKNDLAIADLTSRTIIVRLGNGDGTFRPEVPYPEGGTPAFIVIAHDMNLDGKLDLVVANRGSDDVSVLLGRGDGTFLDAIVSPTGVGTGPYSVAVADFNRDGVPDVATANFMSSNASVLLGVGDGSFDPPIDAGKMGQFSYGVVAGDFNGDGKPDLATSNAVSNDVTVKLNTSH
ncbi:MAG TPA: FG-GAP-like repeat-containing protein [Haliangiales bacterium]|nr:FG-GAP-like repeat-containing protein [Haliangiales bacterium]